MHVVAAQHVFHYTLPGSMCCPLWVWQVVNGQVGRLTCNSSLPTATGTVLALPPLPPSHLLARILSRYELIIVKVADMAVHQGNKGSLVIACVRSRTLTYPTHARWWSVSLPSHAVCCTASRGSTAAASGTEIQRCQRLGLLVLTGMFVFLNGQFWVHHGMQTAVTIT